jgi:hypothetical protein
MITKRFSRAMAVVIVAAAMSSLAQNAGPAAQDAKTQETSQPLKGIVKATVETSKGTFELELDSDKAPLSVQNFVNYAKKGHFDGTIFHRCIPGFIIQGGDSLQT